MSEKPFHYQTTDGAITVHGVRLVSRYGSLSELRQMIDFVERAKAAWVARYVKEVFYDGKSCCASFEFHVKPETGDPVFSKVLEVAKQTIAQFELGGTIYHGGPRAGSVALDEVLHAAGTYRPDGGEIERRDN